MYANVVWHDIVHFTLAISGGAASQLALRCSR
jgi:hypothetical protein